MLGFCGLTNMQKVNMTVHCRQERLVQEKTDKGANMQENLNSSFFKNTYYPIYNFVLCTPST